MGIKERIADCKEELRRIKEEEGGDVERAHVLADDALLGCINDPVVTDLFYDIDKWYA